MLEIVSGNLIEAKEKYLCHQTNCVTNRSAHLAKTVFKAFPYADIYTLRKSPDSPGTIIVSGDGDTQRYVINLLGQYYPGSPRYPDSTLDGYKAREKYLRLGLFAVSKIPNLESIAFPFKMGCGAAGGNWESYLTILTNFANYVEKTQSAKVVVYKLLED